MENSLSPASSQGSGAVPKQGRQRLSNACDACRSRKTKCVPQGLSCRTCTELKISCTQDKPRKRRGPPNKYVLTQVGSAHIANDSDNLITPGIPSGQSFHEVTLNPLSPAAAATSLPPRGIHRLAPPEVIEKIVRSWFDLIHSVAPIFHRGLFLDRLATDEASRDGLFAALVVSVCAATLVSLRRKTYRDFGSLTPGQCWSVIEAMCPTRWRQPYTLEWCQLKYNMAASQQGSDNCQSFVDASEAAAGVKYLIYYEMSKMDMVSQQLLKRLYWLIFASNCSSDLHGLPYVSLLTPQDNIIALTPLELSDNELAPDHPSSSLWHGDRKSYIPGLNYLSKLFLLWHQSQQEPVRTVAHLQHYMSLVERALDYLPPSLIWRGGLSRPPQSNFNTEVQTANLYITQLHIRSNLLQQMNRLSAGAFVTEQQSIVEDLLEILYHMPQETLEANGNSLVPKIRDIGSVLLEGKEDGGGEECEKVAGNLQRLLEKLESLDMQSQLQYLEMNSPLVVDVNNT